MRREQEKYLRDECFEKRLQVIKKIKLSSLFVAEGRQWKAGLSELNCHLLC